MSDVVMDPDPEDSVDEEPEPTPVKLPGIVIVVAWMVAITLGYFWIGFIFQTVMAFLNWVAHR